MTIHTPRLDAEIAVISGLMLRPEMVSGVTSKLIRADFADPFLGYVYSLMSDLSSDGRTPSLHAVQMAVGEADRPVLKNMITNCSIGLMLPLEDAVEVVRDQAQRERLSGVSQWINAQSAGNHGVSAHDVAAEAVRQLDDIIAAGRSGQRRSYDAEGAATAAITHLDATDRVYPTTGLADLDDMTGGWPLGQLTIWAGRPGMGKSACATSAVLRAARAGHGVAFFSLEMMGEQLGSRLLTDLAYTHSDPIYYEDILKRKIDERQRQRLERAAEALRGIPLHIEEQRGLTLAEIQARCAKLAAAWQREGKRLDVVCVDHMGLVRASSRYAGNRVNEVAEISDGLATMAKDLDCAVVALCQLNRQVEGRDNKRPGLSDLRDSGTIEQDASLVIFAYRAAYYLETRVDDPAADAARQMALEGCRRKIEFVVAKNRNGRCGTVDAYCDIGANAIRNAGFCR